MPVGDLRPIMFIDVFLLKPAVEDFYLFDFFTIAFAFGPENKIFIM